MKTMTLSVHLDEQGRLRGQFAGERHGGVPKKRWKIAEAIHEGWKPSL
jgi:hypothetical protein